MVGAQPLQAVFIEYPKHYRRNFIGHGMCVIHTLRAGIISVQCCIISQCRMFFWRTSEQTFVTRASAVDLKKCPRLHWSKLKAVLFQQSSIGFYFLASAAEETIYLDRTI